MNMIKNQEALRKEMGDAQKQQKILLEKRDLFLSSKPPNQHDALQTTHKIAKLQDFIKFAENTLKMLDWITPQKIIRKSILHHE